VRPGAANRWPRSLGDARGAAGPTAAVGLAALAILATGELQAGAMPQLVETTVCVLEGALPRQPPCGEGEDEGEGEDGAPRLLRVNDPDTDSAAPGSDTQLLFEDIHVGSTIVPRGRFTRVIGRAIGASAGNGVSWRIAAGTVVRVEPGTRAGSWTLTFPAGGATFCYAPARAFCVPVRGFDFSAEGIETFRTGIAMGDPARQAGARQMLDALLFWTNPELDRGRRRLDLVLDITSAALEFWRERGATLPARIGFNRGPLAGEYIYSRRSIEIGLGVFLTSRVDYFGEAVFVVAHEIGHSVQPQGARGDRYRRFPREMENQASCLAGYFMGYALERRLIAQEHIAQAEARLRYPRRGPFGPPPAEELAWFQRGVAGWRARRSSSAACPD
jgi:hypothetical protein